MSEKTRIEALDVLRGISVLGMIFHHTVYDLYAFCGAPATWFHNPLMDLVHYVFGSLFILLCGISSNFSRSNVKRGAKAMAIALVITAVTALLDMIIVYGVLHFLATAMLLYGLTQRLRESLPRIVLPLFSAAGLALTYPLANGVLTETPHLWIFGLTTADFASSDYFPLLPWIFVFLFGTWLGRYVKEGRFPSFFYRVKEPRLAAIGRHSLAIYVVHQPILFALSMALSLFL